MNKIFSFFKLSLTPVLVLVIWEISFRANILNLAFISSPSQIFEVFFQTNFWQILGADFGYTLARLVIGFILGYLLAYLLIFVVILVPFFENIFRQLNSFIKYIPIPVLIPIAILIFGLTDFTKIFVVVLAVFVLYFNYLLEILGKEEKAFSDLQKSWKIQPVERFFGFFVPISTFLSYRVVGSTLIWAIGIEVIVEAIVGGKFGLGIRIIEFQQLFLTGFLYAYIFVIILLGFVLERSLVYSFSRLNWDKIKIFCTAFLAIISIFSVIFLGQTLFASLNFGNLRYITSYKAMINLPVFVYLEKYNDLGLVYNETSSGIPATNSLQAQKSAVAGFSDLPNVISGISKNPRLKIVAQSEEKKDNASLFLIAKRDGVTEKDFSSLNSSVMGYYPDNRVILAGLEFSVNLKKANSASIDFTTSGDPQSQVQAFISGQTQSVLHIEPYITRMEKATGIKRVNAKNSLIEGLKFESLPLAGLVIDSEKFTDSESRNLFGNIQKSIEYIQNHTTSQNRADSELAKIMQKYDLDTESSIPAFNFDKNSMSKNLAVLVDLLRIISTDLTKDIKNEELISYYL